jgi:hypothetical protein
MKVYQTAVKCPKWPFNTYDNIYNSKALQKFTQIVIFGLNIYHLATLEYIAEVIFFIPSLWNGPLP